MAEVGTDLLWLSKRALSYLKLSVPHQLYDRDDGWRIEVVREGVLEVGFVDGQRQELRVEQGSVLAASGEEILVLPPRRDREDQRMERPRPEGSDAPTPRPTRRASAEEER